MMAFPAIALLVVFVDQAAKEIVRRRLGVRVLSLGVFGHLRVVEARVWALRVSARTTREKLWACWAGATGICVLVAFLEPRFGWSLGLLVGGALSHALETTRHGCVCDYICLRYWPPFNLADVALTAGLVGAIGTLLAHAT